MESQITQGLSSLKQGDSVHYEKQTASALTKLQTSTHPKHETHQDGDPTKTIPKDSDMDSITGRRNSRNRNGDRDRDKDRQRRKYRSKDRYMFSRVNAYTGDLYVDALYIHIPTYIYPSIPPSLPPSIHPSVHPCIHASMHPCMRASMHPYIHAYLCMCVYMYVHVCTGLRT